MKFFCCLVLGSLLTTVGAYATSVRPPSFDDLISSSELIFSGRVTSMRCGWRGDGAQSHVTTRVTFQVERGLKGSAAETLTLEFMGGEIGGRRFEVVGVPRFQIGDRGVFFVENRAGRLCPLARLRHGRYRVVSDRTGATARILRDDYTPLRESAAVSAPLQELAEPQRAALADDGLTLAEFEQQIIARASELAMAGDTR